MPPTLFIPGSLRDPEGDSERQKALNSWVPIDYCLKWFNDRILLNGPKNRLLFVKAGTASAKSTGLITEVYLKFVKTVSQYGRRGIICTQPRVLTAIKNVSQIVSIPGYSSLQIGRDIGWSTQYDKMRPERFGILSATIGTLAAKMTMGSDDDIMNSYQVIFIDETHERNLQTDLVILMLYNFLARNANDPRCPFVVFMSATFDPEIYVNHFKKMDNGISLLGNYIQVVGQSVGYDVYWPKKEEVPENEKIWDLAAKKVLDIVSNGKEDSEDSCDVLIFMPGAKEIEETEKSLKKILTGTEFFEETLIMPISSKEIEEQSENFKNLDKKNSEIRVNGTVGKIRRKVVISTVIAETGLTLDQLKYVIETGFHRATVFNPNFMIDSLISESAPKSRITQRFGRVGRKTRGTVYPLYTKETYDHFLDQQFPEIIVNDFGDILLPVLLETIKDSSGNINPDQIIHLEDIKMLDMPATSSLLMTLEQAYKLGFICPCPYKDKDSDTRQGFKLSKMGISLGRLGLKLSSARLLAACHVYNYSPYDIVGLVAVLESMSGRDLSKVKFQEVYKKVFGNKSKVIQALISDDFGNIMTMMHYFVHLFDNGIPDVENILKEIGLKKELFDFIMTTRDRIMNNLLTIGFSLIPKGGCHSIFDTQNKMDSQEYFGNSLTRFKYCIHDSFKTNVLVLSESGHYTFKGIKVSVPHFKRNEIKELTDLDEIIYPKYLVFDYLDSVVKGSEMNVTAYRISTMSGYCYLDMY